jgi:Na+/melibiose symporter-like transporter
MGGNLLLISFFVALARAIEILLKPTIAHFSDISQMKMGRRIPYILMGMPFYAILIVIIFHPPQTYDSVHISLYFGLFYVLFFIADTVCNVPYSALGPELSSNSREREKLYIVVYCFNYIGILFASGGPLVYSKFFKNCDCKYCDLPTIKDKYTCNIKCKVACDFHTNQNGLLYISIIIGLIYALSTLLLSVTLEEKKKSFRDEEKSFLVPKLYRLLKNKPFIMLAIPWMIDITISTIFATMFPFFVTVIINPQKYCIENKIDLNSYVCSTSTWYVLNFNQARLWNFNILHYLYYIYVFLAYHCETLIKEKVLVSV